MRVLRVRHEALVDTLPPEVEEKLTFKVIDQYGEKETVIKAYRETEEGVYIPRAFVPSFLDLIEDAGWEKVDIPFYGELRPYQLELAEAFLNGKRNGVISAGTGTGKTVIGLYIAHKIGLKTLVVVPSDILFFQWIERCKQFCGIKPSKIRGDICSYDQPITIAMLHTLALGKKIDRTQLYDKFGLVIYDEVHRLPTEKFSVVASMFWDRYRLGLSATPTRRDGLHYLFFYHIGQVVANYSVPRMIPIVYKINYVDPTTSTAPFRKEGKFNVPRYITHLVEITPRNQLIAYYVYQGYKHNRKILVLTDRLSHISNIQHWLLELGVKKDEIGLLTGEVKEIGKPILFGTYGTAGTGLDIPELDCLILATPRSDVRQAIGRALRPKKVVPIIIDIVDAYSQVMKNFGRSREKIYRAMGCKIKEIIVTKEDVNVQFQRMVGKQSH